MADGPDDNIQPVNDGSSARSFDAGAQPNGAPSAMGGGPIPPAIARFSNTPAPMNTRQAPPAPAPQAPAAADTAHHTMLGKAFRALMGDPVQYKADPSGKVVPVPVPQKPGQIFRSIVAAAILGGATGAQSPRPGFMGGFSAGAEAEMAQKKEADQQSYERARQAAADQREAQKTQDEHVLHQATIAHTNIQASFLQHQLHNLEEEDLLKHKAAATTYENILKNAEGSKPVQFSVGGKPMGSMTAPEFAQAYIKDPSLMHSPSDDYVRHFVDINDATELHQAGPGQWVDDSGNPVRLTDSTIIRAYDIPTRTFKTPQMVSGAEVVKLNPALKGTLDETKNYPISPEAAAVLKQDNDKHLSEAALTNQRNAEAQKNRAEAGEATERGKLAQAQRESIAKVGTPVSENFKADPDAFKKSEQQLRESWSAQGQTLPPDFATLYSIGHYDSNLTSNYSARPYNRPGVPPQKSSAQATAFIRTFINPNYDENNFKAVQKMEEEYASSRPNTAGGSAIAFSTATRHVGMLYDAALALKNHDVPAWNRVVQYVQTATGKNVKPNFDAVKAALVGEIGKTFKGAAVDIPEREALDATIQSSGSPDQLLNDGVLARYANLMRSKMDALDQHYFNLKGKHSQALVDPEADQVYRKLGINTGGSSSDQKPLSNRQVNPQTQQEIGWDGSQWVDAKTRQPVSK